MRFLRARTSFVFKNHVRIYNDGHATPRALYTVLFSCILIVHCSFALLLDNPIYQRQKNKIMQKQNDTDLKFCCVYFASRQSLYFSRSIFQLRRRAAEGKCDDGSSSTARL